MWTGDGIWEPETLCFDWSHDDFRVTECVFNTTDSGCTQLTKNSNATCSGSCHQLDSVCCPGDTECNQQL